MRHLAFVVAALCAAACAPNERQDARAATAVQEDCGLNLVVNSRMGRPDLPRIRSGQDIRACDLPLAGDIEFACEHVDARDQRDLPDYRVTSAECVFANDARSAARCSFDLAISGAQPVQSEALLTFRFLDLSDETMHDYLATTWRTDASCRAP
jgi:hypothetical protein